MFGKKEDEAMATANTTPGGAGTKPAHDPAKPSSMAPTPVQQSVIGNTCRIVGDITASGLIRIEGDVDGNIRATERIEVGKQASIKGTLSANTVTIAGKVSGAVAASDSARLAAGSELQGDVSTKRLAVEEGAHFNGRSIMDGSDADKNRRQLEPGKLEVVKSPRP